MKKILTAMIFLFTSFSIVKAYEFPNYIKAGVSKNKDSIAILLGYSNGVVVGSNSNPLGTARLFLKNYSATIDGKSFSGRAFCTTYKNAAPGVGNSYKYCNSCKKANWLSGNNANEQKVAMGVGAIIKKTRDNTKLGGGSINNINYYYGELAINKFLYEVRNSSSNSANYISWLDSKNNNYIKVLATEVDKLLKVGKTAYSEYGQDTLSLSGLSDISNNIIKTTATCKNANNEVSCDKVSASAEITINGKTYSNIPLSSEKVKNKYVLSLNISKYIKNLDSYNMTVKIKADNKKDYYKAQNYICGTANNENGKCATGLNGQYLQYLTINRIERVTPTITSNKSRNYTVTAKPQGCAQELAELDSNDKLGLINLYNKYQQNQLLNANNPACKNAINYIDTKCDSSTIENKGIVNRNINGKQYRLYCEHSYQLDNNILNDAFITKGDLLYKSKDGIMAQATSNYNCTLISEDNIDNIKFKINELIPNLTITSSSFNNPLFIVNIDKISDNCTANDTDITCKPTYDASNKVYTLSITTNVNYLYSENNDYGKDKKNNITTMSDCVDCKQMGYGIKLNASEDGSINFDLDTSSNILKSQDNTSTVCNFKVDSNSKGEFLYRSIDTTNPFLTKEGNTRYTGSNWCSYDGFNDSYYIEDNNGENLNDSITGNGLGLQNEEITSESLSNSSNYYMSPCKSNNNLVNEFIKSRANSNGVIENTNVKVEPLYSFTLTPNDIKSIREYNNNHRYDDNDLKCENGRNCISEFVRNQLFDKLESGGICKNNMDTFCNVEEVNK